ncbi:hypothetical protein [Muricoccus vinaceus]|uniref:Uncharacterized protein n=1 Tax=Muricoccus vinaceus TaxID=424704 RepID=A0ABV6IXT1_9PROT
MRAGPCDTAVIADRPRGTAPGGQASGGAAAARTLRPAFFRPFIAHASIGPSCAIA